MRAARRRRTSLLALACVLATACGHVASARADGDPASDFLPSVDAYLPYRPKVDEATGAALRRLLAAARGQGHPVKVAVIGTPNDLGAVTGLFGKPAAYATFLGSEIRTFIRPIRVTLFVVMPAGFGMTGPDATPGARAALARVTIPDPATPHQLAAAAIAGIQAVARANGHALPAVKVPAASETAGGSGGRLALILAIVALVAAASLGALQLRARALRRAGPDGARD